MKRVQLSDSEGKRFVLSKGDLLFARRSLVGEGAGKCSVVLEIDEPTTFESSIIRARPDSTKAEPLYLYYFFNSTHGLHCLDTIRRQVAVAGITGSDLSRLEVSVPPISEQRAIAHILGTLDDKIELNRRMSETLETMARALFKSWFVDFLPVRAKQRARTQTGDPVRAKQPKNVGWVSPSGRNPPDKADGGLRGCAANPPYELPPHIADLFPDRLKDSELGAIPAGWEVKTIGDLAEIVGGSTPSTKEPRYWGGGTHYWATPKDLSNISIPVLLETERCITDDGLLQIGSGLLPKGAVLLSSRAPIGYSAIAEVPVAINQGFIAMKAKKGVSNIFLLLWANVAHDEIISRANGSTFLEISKVNFRPIQVVTPSTTAMRAFEELARPLYARLVECAHESRALSALRDTLLPKLISGELRVRDAERAVELM